LSIVLLLSAVFLLGIVATASAAINTYYVDYNFKSFCPTGPADGARVRAYGQVDPLNNGSWSPQFSPALIWAYASPSGWGTYSSTVANSPLYWRMTQWSSKPPISNQLVTFKIRYAIREHMPKRIWARQRWTLSNVPFGGVRLPGFKYGSQPVLYNSGVDLDDAGNEIANTHDMVVTNLRFAQSPSQIGSEELSLDNPVVQNLFSTSPDTNRPGPMVVAPGEQVEMSASRLGDPVSGGRTLLLKGEVEDEAGSTVPFLIQWTAEEPATASVPASSTWSLTLCGVLALGAAAYVRRQRAPARQR